jgi:hypothetical protein
VKVDLSSAPTARSAKVMPCLLGTWLLSVDDSQRDDVKAIIYGRGTHAEVGRWLTRNEMDGNTQQIVGRHRNGTCSFCKKNGLQ